MRGYSQILVILYQFKKNNCVKVQTLLHCMWNDILTNQPEMLLKGIHVYLEQFG